MTLPSACFDVFVARQPIFQLDGRLSAYELLYRKSEQHQSAQHASADVMAAEVLVQTFLNMGLDRVTGEASAYLNFTRDMLVQGVWGLFDPKKVVIEILETVEPDDEVVATVETMVKNGYTIALDDFEYSPAYERLLDLATIVKVDVLNRSFEDLDGLAAQLRKRSVAMLAERVETKEVEVRCRSLGFTLFQGYYYQRPEILVKKELGTAQLTILRLMNLLRDTTSSDSQLEEAFRGDVSMTVKLLRTVNAASMGGRGIESIRHAVRLVGRSELHKWLSLMLVSSVASRGGTDVELVRVALTRARLAELIGLQRGDRRGSEGLFMVGLFSLLDALLRIPLADILQRIELAEEIKRALMLRAGPYAPALMLVEAYERAKWDVVSAESSTLGVDAGLLGDMYLASVAWARDRLGEN
ncbi:MAG: EAL and HDOD domain-containing protein [Gemmatimonadaceae bacterium]